MDLPIYKLKTWHTPNGYHIRRYTDLSHAMHFHDFIELTIMEKGSGVHVINGKEYHFPMYAFSIMDHRDYHAFFNLTPGNSLYNLQLSPYLISNKNLEAILQLTSDKICYLNKEIGRIIISLFDSLFYLEKSKSSPTPNLIQNVCDNLIELFLTNFTNQDEYDASNFKSEIQPALEYINLHYKEPLALQEVAEIANYNPSHFSKLFHIKMGITFNHYVISTRVNYAKNLLATSDYPIAFICFECGFASISSFNRNFMKIVGVSPNAYRAKFKF